MKVLDKGYVELQSVMGNDLAIVNAARTSFLGESKGAEKDKKLLMYLMKHRHTTPFEHVVFKFRVKAPVVVWWHWVRHRTQSYNFQSGRYVKHDDEFYVPSEWRLQSKDNKQGSDGVYDGSFTVSLLAHYRRSYLLYEEALDKGIAKEQARLFLPAWGIYYTGVCTVNAHNLMGWLRLRMANDAQYEIRQYAYAIYEIFKKELPWTAEGFDDVREM